MPNFRLLCPGIECTLEAETSVSNLTRYKLFIGDDKNNAPFGVTFSFKNNRKAIRSLQGG